MDLKIKHTNDPSTSLGPFIVPHRLSSVPRLLFSFLTRLVQS